MKMAPETQKKHNSRLKKSKQKYKVGNGKDDVRGGDVIRDNVRGNAGRGDTGRDDVKRVDARRVDARKGDTKMLLHGSGPKNIKKSVILSQKRVNRKIK